MMNTSEGRLRSTIVDCFPEGELVYNKGKHSLYTSTIGEIFLDDRVGTMDINILI